jgi:GntR family transcriptional regulator, transcriptional repressor for pyruvate dehydrogenase complex
MIAHVPHKKLSDVLAERLHSYILGTNAAPGDRLPPSAELVKKFGVGYPTLREALKRLEALGVVSLRHGSGIYVGDSLRSFFLVNPIPPVKVPTQKLLLDLVDAREPIELQAAGLAAGNRTAAHVARLQSILRKAGENLDNDDLLNRFNMEFHSNIAEASGNEVLPQMLQVVTRLFTREQRVIIHIYGSREEDHEQHKQLLEAIRRRDRSLSVKLMRAHLASVRKAILHWKPPHGVQA